jgi:hypothetical protein
VRLPFRCRPSVTVVFVFKQLLTFPEFYYKKGKTCQKNVKQRDYFCENILMTLEFGRFLRKIFGFSETFRGKMCKTGANACISLKKYAVFKFFTITFAKIFAKYLPRWVEQRGGPRGGLRGGPRGGFRGRGWGARGGRYDGY